MGPGDHQSVVSLSTTSAGEAGERRVSHLNPSTSAATSFPSYNQANTVSPTASGRVLQNTVPRKATNSAVCLWSGHPVSPETHWGLIWAGRGTGGRRVAWSVRALEGGSEDACPAQAVGAPAQGWPTSCPPWGQTRCNSESSAGTVTSDDPAWGTVRCELPSPMLPTITGANVTQAISAQTEKRSRQELGKKLGTFTSRITYNRHLPSPTRTCSSSYRP